MWIVDGCFKYWGKFSDVCFVIVESLVYVLFFYCEGMLCMVLEVMVMGWVIIIIDVLGCCEMVLYGVNGYLVVVKLVDELV